MNEVLILKKKLSKFPVPSAYNIKLKGKGLEVISRVSVAFYALKIVRVI